MTEKTEGITFRLEESTIEKLKEFSELEKISTNTLVKHVLDDYLKWDAYAVKAGWMVFPKPALKILIDDASEKTLSKLAITMADYKKDITLLMTGDNTLEGFLSVVRNRIRKSGFQLRESEDENGISFVIQHDMGLKWSLLNKSMYEKILKNLGYTSIIDITDNTLIIKIPRKN